MNARTIQLKVIGHGLIRATIVFTMLILSVFLLPGYAADQFGSVRGTVVNTDTGQPIDKAKVRLRVKRGAVAVAVMPTNKNMFPVMTGPDGQFEFNEIPIGEYSLKASKKNYFHYSSSKQVFAIQSGKTTTQMIKIKKNPIIPRKSAESGKLSSEHSGSPVSNNELLATYITAKINGDYKKASEILRKIPRELQNQAQTKAIQTAMGMKPELKFQEPKQKISYSGIVVDSITGRPVEKVKVSLASYDSVKNRKGSRKTKSTDSNGYFIFKKIWTGDYILLARKPQYTNNEQTIQITTEAETSKTIKMVKAPEQPEKPLILLELGSLSGTVVDSETNLPVEQIEINLVPSMEIASKMLLASNLKMLEKSTFKVLGTGNDGHFEFKAIPVGEYKLLALKKAPAKTPHYFGEEKRIHIKVNSETTKTIKVMRLPGPPPSAIVLSGYIYDQATDKPVEGALLSNTNQSVSTHSDSRGYFSIKTIPGELKLTVSHNNYQYYNKEFTISDSKKSELRIDLQPITTGDIYGIVVNSVTGDPVADVKITMAGQGLITNKEGRFQLLATEAGVIPSNFEHKNYYSNTVNIILKALTKENITIKIKPVTIGKISGLVVNAVTQSPIAGALVRSLTASVHTDAKGQFVLEKIEAGSVNVYSSAHVYVSAEQQVDVKALQTTNINISLDPVTWGSVTGQILDSATKLPIPEVEINLGGLAAYTDAQGYFTLHKVPAGKFLLAAKEPRYHSGSQSVSLAATESIDTSLMLDPITTGNISGLVFDANTHDPIASAEVNIHGNSMQTDAEGYFIFEKVEAGTVVVNAIAQKYISAKKNVDVIPVQTSKLKISLEPVTWGTVAGQVVDAITKDPIANAVIKLDDITLSTNETGRFLHEKVPSGTISVLASKAVYYSGSKSVALAPTESLDITIKLDPIITGSISGIVLDADTQKPIAKASVTANGQSVISDVYGHFELTEVSAGDIQVLSSKAAYENNIVSVKLAAADTKKINIPMELISTGHLSGVLIDAVSGRPIKGVRIIIGEQAFETDQNGYFELGSVTAGKVMVSSRHPDYKDATTELEIKPSGSVKINLKLDLRREDVAELETRLSQDGTIDLYGIHFDSGKDKFKSSSLPTLQALLEVIRRAPDKQFLVAGHTDSDGNNNYNQALSERRAANVIHWLIEKGVDKVQLSSRGYGETQPSAPNNSESGKALNRRVQLSVMK